MISIQLFGAFRDYAGDNIVTLDLDAPISIDAVKTGLKDKLAANDDDGKLAHLLSISRVATAKRVMKDEEILQDNGDLAILPPVSGG